MRYISAILGFTLVCFTSPALRAETLEDVEKKIAEMSSKHKSVEMKMKSKTDISSQGMSMKSDAESVALYAKKGDKWLSRTDSKMSSVNKFGDQPEQKDDSKVMTVYDGEYVYILSETSQGKQAMKRKPDLKEIEAFNGKKMWEEMHKGFDIKLLPDEMVDGKSCWMIELKPKPTKEMPSDGSKSVTYYRKSDGVGVKSVSYDKDGKAMSTMQVTDVKFDIEPKADAFKFKAPEGVTVTEMPTNPGQAQDQTKTEDNTAAQASPEPKEDEKPKEQPKQEEQPKPKKKGIGGLLNKLK